MRLTSVLGPQPRGAGAATAEGGTQKLTNSAGVICGNPSATTSTA